MILEKKYEFNLHKQFTKICYLYPAFNDTFVLLGLIVPRVDGIVHLDSQGKVLKVHRFKDPTDAIGMLSDRELIVAETRLDRISVLDLETYEWKHMPFMFMFK